MITQHKPLDQQTVVIIGASSGIGRETALQFARAGSQIVVAARSKHGIQTLVEEIKDIQGPGSHNVVGLTCDVKEREQLEAVANRAIAVFGKIDTWVHTAAVLIVANVEDTTEEEAKQIMDVNYMGVLRTIWTSIPHLKRTKGALIILGSVEGRRSVINHGLYATSKHAIKGTIEALRMELYRDDAGVTVTEIIPPTMDTPFYDKARVKVDDGKYKYAGPPLIYTPNVAAECILYAAQFPTKELYVGLAASVLSKLQSIFPSILDKSMVYFGTLMEKTHYLKGNKDNFEEAFDDDSVNKSLGSWGAHSLSFSPYNWVVMKLPTWPFRWY
ncbi:corticosteroid 11-beta-dehydrogenase [Acrasis kona]|uniref:Corticosteroid 11-beta-dehydrogenase n=1 Tax=Acrasis kona TaxID=1008807 RepID=A0AAW2YTX6_9EUKA